MRNCIAVLAVVIGAFALVCTVAIGVMRGWAFRRT